MTPYTSLASSSKGRPALALDVALPATVNGGGGGVPLPVPDKGTWPASPNATTTPEAEESVLRGLEKGVDPGVGVPGAEEDEAAGSKGGERACETPGRSAPPSLARFGRLVRCCQSW
jgi:hypothetical protein